MITLLDVDTDFNVSTMVPTTGPWKDYYKEMNAQTGPKPPSLGAQWSQAFREQQKAAQKQEQDDKNRIQIRFRSKIRFDVPPPVISSSIKLSQPFNNSDAPAIEFEIVTPQTIDTLFTTLQKKGYQIKGLQESGTLSSIAAVNERVNCYQPELVFPSAAAFEQYMNFVTYD
ncbi:hypothetical protein GYMLUDRAFT_65098 [Collybiopsis luxurians FD-317 M1]|uniref:Uncharacterized protein n=1 Tax=Collybiopsis luxurians FD-317 M1 TaxID=944289 RepID=A0A0D0C007_9AGAR|nr:hypothetical protein GYMLUDRAFT_65098 [Collybiopsis luxurians FD-317 M1]